MGTLANAFVLLADQEGEEASTIIALKSAELIAVKKKITAEKEKAKAKNKKPKKSSVKNGGGGGKEGQRSLDGHQHNRPSDGSSNRNGRGDGPVYMKGCKAVGHHGNENQRKVSVRTVPLSREESRERWLAREEENRKDMAMMTLKEYEEQKAYEKQKAEKTNLSVSVSEATLDNTNTTQNSKNVTVKKDSYLDKNEKSKDEKYWKAHKKVNIAGFFTDEDNTMKVGAAGPALDLSEMSFPVLGKVTKPIKFYWE
ncbi:hypothetical protein ACET3Z_003818 [Daucus carota]